MSNPPDTATTGPSPASTPVVAPQRMRFAAFGDSLMWGQGLARETRFSVLVAQGIGKLHGREGKLVFDKSRSGAQIAAGESDRPDFVDTYPNCFDTPNEVHRFLTQGDRDETPATRLFGEVPATFPTITWQVEKGIPAATAADIDVALVCGGGNDIGFEKVLDPRTNRGTFVDVFAPDVEKICFTDTLTILETMRARMPKAVILLFGYHSPFSQESSLGAMRGYFKHEFDSDVEWWLNSQANKINVPLPGGENVNRLVAAARVRSVWAQGLATYWLRRAVTAPCGKDALRGPGIIFVPCGFHPDESVWSGSSMIWDDYEHPTKDPMQPERRHNLPRLGLLPALRDTRALLALLGLELEPAKAAIKALAEQIDAPTSLKEALMRGNPVGGPTLVERLAHEIHRIQRALIASFVHPNTQGARTYANMAIARYKLHRTLRASLPPSGSGPQPRPVPGDPEPFEDRLERFNLRRKGALQGHVGHEFIDAIQVTVKTSSDSDRGFPADVYLNLVLNVNRPNITRPDGTVVRDQRPNTVPLQLNMRYYLSASVHGWEVTKFHPEFEPGRSDGFTVDVSGHADNRRVLLREVKGVQLVVGDWSDFSDDRDRSWTWMPEDFRLDINGIEVLKRNLRGKRLHPGDHLDLAYPAPVQEAPPVLASTILREVQFPAE